MIGFIIVQTINGSPRLPLIVCHGRESIRHHNGQHPATLHKHSTHPLRGRPFHYQRNAETPGVLTFSSGEQ
jgi:hypothetical protein